MLEDTTDGGTRVRALTHAVFPGVHGRLYRAAVIGSRGHVVAVRLVLRALERRVADPVQDG